MELSNKTLIYLIAIATLLTLFSTTYNLTKLQDIESLSGLVTSQSGPVNVTVAATASINLTLFSINWGSGQVDTGQENATLDTQGTAYVRGGTWSTSGISGFELQNIGNVLLNITINGTGNATKYIGAVSGPAFIFDSKDATGNSSACETSPLTGQQDFNDSLKIVICHGLNYTLNRDFLTIDINITIPDDTPTGSKNATVTFDACDVSGGTCSP